MSENPPEDERVPVTWDEDTNLNEPTVAASMKVKFYIDENIDRLFEQLYNEGMYVRNPQLVWQLIGIQLRICADAMEVAMENATKAGVLVEVEQVEEESFEARDSKPG